MTDSCFSHQTHHTRATLSIFFTEHELKPAEKPKKDEGDIALNEL
jgi:hypothetical protein